MQLLNLFFSKDNNIAHSIHFVVLAPGNRKIKRLTYFEIREREGLENKALAHIQ